jgi:hypothetical protein
MRLNLSHPRCRVSYYLTSRRSLAQALAMATLPTVFNAMSVGCAHSEMSFFFCYALAIHSWRHYPANRHHTRKYSITY